MSETAKHDKNFKLPYTPKYEFVETEERAKEVCEILSQRKVLAVDTETTGLDPYTSKILLLQIATPDICYILNCNKVNPNVWGSILKDPSILKIFQNAKFDYKMLKVHAGVSTRNVFDTMIAELILTAGKARKFVTLAALARKYLGMELDKEIRKEFVDRITIEFTESQLLYAANDALILHSIYDAQVNTLQKDELIDVAVLEFETIIPLSEMELSGVVLDKIKWRENLVIAQKKRDEVEAKINRALTHVSSQLSIFGECTINIGSTKQLLKALNDLGLKVEDTSEAALKKERHQVIDWILEWRGWNTILERYGESLLEKENSVTGRIHPEFIQMGAATGRMSSCFPAGTKISTRNGIKNIEDITNNDYVMTRYGFKKVIKQWCSGKDYLWDVSLLDGSNILCTGNHRVFTYSGWKTVDSLSLEDRMYYSYTEDYSENTGLVYIGDLYVGDQKPHREFIKQEYFTNDLATILGYALGDGSLRRGRTTNLGLERFDKLTLAVSWDDEDLINILKNKVYNTFGVEITTRKWTCNEVLINSTNVCMLFSNIGMDKKSIYRRVADVVFRSPKVVIASFLSGLFEADGNIFDGSVRLDSSSLGLLKDVQCLLYHLGIRSKIRKKNICGGFKRNSDPYTLYLLGARSVHIFRKRIGFLSKRKNDLLNKSFDDARDGKDVFFLPEGNKRNDMRSELYKEGVSEYGGCSLGIGFFGSRKNKNNTINWSSICAIKSTLPLFFNSSVSFSFIKNIYVSNLKELKIKNILKTDAFCDVYDLQVEGEEFLVNGVVVHNSSPNAQNIPRYDPKDPNSLDLRSCFVCPPGYRFSVADYSQQELRCLAELSKDKSLVEAYTNNEDLHTKTASYIFNTPKDKVSKAQRQVAKTVNFAVSYGASKFRIADELKIDVDEAEKIINNYFQAYPGVKAYLQNTTNFAVQNGHSLNIDKRRRYFEVPSIDDVDYKKKIGSISREAGNARIQGSCASVSKKALCIFLDRCEKENLDVQLAIIVHDEIACYAKEDQAYKVAKILEDSMKDGWFYYFKKVPMVVEAVVSDTWKH